MRRPIASCCNAGQFAGNASVLLLALQRAAPTVNKDYGWPYVERFSNNQLIIDQCKASPRLAIGANSST